jgi:HEAT repeat protein
MKQRVYLACSLMMCAMVGTVAHAQRAHAARAPRMLDVAPADAADSLYRAGRDAINDRDYRKAATLFQQLIDKYPSSNRVADALYWRAWSLYLLASDTGNKSNYDDALASVNRYNRDFGKTGSLSTEAKELYSRIRTAQAKLGDADAAGDVARAAQGLTQARSCTGSTSDEETRMAALEGLLSMSSEDAVPILKEVLKQRDPCRAELRKKAVWMLSEKRAPDVVTTLLDVARNDPSMDVRTDAVYWLSQTHSEQAIPALDSILSSTGNDEMRKKAIFSLAQFHEERARQALRRAVENEQLPEELRGEAVFWLGDTPSNTNLEYFKTFFKKTRSTELRSRVVQAVSNTPTPEAGAWLLDIARDKSFDTETRKNAIFWASQRKTFDFDQLSGIYDQAKGDDEIQKQVLFVYSQRHEPAAVDKLMTIAKSDSNIEMRKQALFWLGQKNDPRVKQFIRDLISK